LDEAQREAAAGWEASAEAYIAFQDAEDRNRTMLLDPVMLDLCGDVRGTRVLDIGCGEGRFCRMLAQRGASCVGIDLTPAMVRAARERQAAARGAPAGDAGRGGGVFVRGSAEQLPFADASFDLAVSYITLVDIVDYAESIRESARVLRPGGMLVAANLGFVTASEGWLRDEAGKRLYHRVDRYAEERRQVFEWSGMRIVNWHRPLSAYMQAYLGAGLVLRDFLEPVPEDKSLVELDYDYYEDWYRVPLSTVMRWQKRCEP
jgi:ubiquinone/menaquinone biosynthesis C-methylase UbiE